MKTIIIVLIAFIFIYSIIYFGNDIIRQCVSIKNSQSLGTVKNGNLVYGKRLPSKGINFITCSRLRSLLVRNSVKNLVRETVLESYDSVYKAMPEITFVYGETSWPNGGRLWPHKTHENGLSVDFFVPLRNKKGESVVFPTSIFNKFGYGVEFDSLGRSNELIIDFEAMALHLYNLERTAKKHGLGINVVIFDNQLQTLLFKTKYGEKIKDYMKFSTLKPWVRHDQHYHVDFAILEK